MKRTIKSILCLLLCVIMMIPSVTLLTVFAAPAKVTGVRLTVNTATNQTISWSAASGAKGYYVYKYVDGAGFQKIGSTTKTTYTITKLTNATTYYYRVRAYSGSSTGAISDMLKTVTVGTPSRLRLDAVGTTWQTLKWNSVPGATGYKLYTYRMGAWALVITTRATSYTVRNLSEATDYTYRVCAYINRTSAASNGKFTSSVTFTTCPQKVVGLTATSVASTGVTLRWNSDSKATAYHVFKYDTTNGKYVLLGIARINSFTVEGLEPLSTTIFRVRSYCSRYNNSYSPLSDILKVTTAPGQVLGLRSQLSGTAIKFMWDKLDGATGYSVAVYDDKADSWSVKQTSTSNTFDVTGLVSGAKVKIKVRAYISTDMGYLFGDYSDEYIGSTAPDVPSRVAASETNEGGVKVTWTAVSGATGYQVFRRQKGETEWVYAKITTNTQYIDNDLMESGVYQYKVRAYYAGSDKLYYSIYSDPVEVDYTYKQQGPINPLFAQILSAGLIGYLYDRQGNFFYTATDPWQRNFGFSEIYDIAAPVTVMFYDTIRIKFQDYNNYDWMVQLWKGQYGWVFKGGEIGIYTKPLDRTYEFYDCATDENSMMLSLDCYFKVVNTYEHIFTREYDLYWWATGFVPGTAWLPNDRENIRLDIRITMKDFAMLDKFCYALEHVGDDSKNDIKFNYKRNTKANVLFATGYYTVKGLDVYFSY